MTECIKVFGKDTAEYKLLEAAAAMLTEQSPNKYRYYVGETYFDFGQGWKWTTIICDNNSEWGGYQALNPREQEEVLNGNIAGAVESVFNSPYNPDRRRA